MGGRAKAAVGRLLEWVEGSPKRVLGGSLAITATAALLLFADASLVESGKGEPPDSVGYAWVSFGLAFAGPAAAAFAAARLVRRYADRHGRIVRSGVIALALLITPFAWIAVVWSECVLAPRGTPPMSSDLSVAASLSGGVGAAIWNVLVLRWEGSPSGYGAYAEELSNATEHDPVWLQLSDDAMLDLWKAGVPVQDAAELLLQRQPPTQIAAAYRDGVPPALVSGAL